MSEETENQEPQFELINVGYDGAMVISREENAFAIHEHPLPMRAAEWLLRDLREDPDMWSVGGDDPGRFYERAIQIRDLLDFNKSPEENAREIAFQDFRFGIPPWPQREVTSQSSDEFEEVPF